MSEQISSITRGPRQSNFELLRIVAMFMVLALHANYISFGQPGKADILAAPAAEIGRIALEAMCICAVNVFVMISGWFGIKASLKGFCSFIFQVVYFYALTFLIMYFLGYVEFTSSAILKIFLLRNSGWFVVSYAIMYVLSPILNTFLDHTDKRTIAIVLLSFFAVELYWGFIDKRPDFNEGYSALSFCGLYLLSGYIRRYKSAVCKWGGVIFLVSVALITFFMTIQIAWKFPFNWIAYDAPLAITAAAGLLMFFSRLKIKPNKFINFVAASAFGVYLLHCSPFVISTVFMPLVKTAYYDYGQVAILGVLILIFAVAVIIDQFRKVIWHTLSKTVLN
ncbi:MAG: acyltransferase family protein [Bacteroides sp.]|nr:acyltransferase family protein [Bacteroides sp.]MCM1378729.1 acyltransferase family protein [Bacteroides sp.]MCM1445346.1 acyltransferase family protein [Prevotella sp.]